MLSRRLSQTRFPRETVDSESEMLLRGMDEGLLCVMSSKAIKKKKKIVFVVEHSDSGDI